MSMSTHIYQRAGALSGEKQSLFDNSDDMSEAPSIGFTNDDDQEEDDTYRQHHNDSQMNGDEFSGVDDVSYDDNIQSQDGSISVGADDDDDDRIPMDDDDDDLEEGSLSDDEEENNTSNVNNRSIEVEHMLHDLLLRQRTNNTITYDLYRQSLIELNSKWATIHEEIVMEQEHHICSILNDRANMEMRFDAELEEIRTLHDKEKAQMKQELMEQSQKIILEEMKVYADRERCFKDELDEAIDTAVRETADALNEDFQITLNGFKIAEEEMKNRYEKMIEEAKVHAVYNASESIQKKSDFKMEAILEQNEELKVQVIDLTYQLNKLEAMTSLNSPERAKLLQEKESSTEFEIPRTPPRNNLKETADITGKETVIDNLKKRFSSPKKNNESFALQNRISELELNIERLKADSEVKSEYIEKLTQEKDDYIKKLQDNIKTSQGRYETIISQLEDKIECLEQEMSSEIEKAIKAYEKDIVTSYQGKISRLEEENQILTHQFESKLKEKLASSQAVHQKEIDTMMDNFEQEKMTMLQSVDTENEETIEKIRLELQQDFDARLSETVVEWEDKLKKEKQHNEEMKKEYEEKINLIIIQLKREVVTLKSMHVQELKKVEVEAEKKWIERANVTSREPYDTHDYSREENKKCDDETHVRTESCNEVRDNQEPDFTAISPSRRMFSSRPPLSPSSRKIHSSKSARRPQYDNDEESPPSIRALSRPSFDSVTTSPKSHKFLRKSTPNTRRSVSSAPVSTRSPIRSSRTSSLVTSGVINNTGILLLILNVGVTTHVQKMCHALNIKITDNPMEATHVIAGDFQTQLRRTAKLMAALCKTSNILKGEWLTESYRKKRLLPINHYLLLNDKKAERLYRFTMKQTLREGNERRIEGGLLFGWNIFICDHVAGNKAPSENELKMIISAAGGRWLTMEDISSHPIDFDPTHVIVITSDPPHPRQVSDPYVQNAADNGAGYFTTSWLFECMMHQKIFGIRRGLGRY